MTMFKTTPRSLLITLLILVATPSMARTLQDEFNDQCRAEAGDDKSAAFQQCLATKQQRFLDAVTPAIIPKNRDALEKSLGTAREMAKRCEDVDTNSGALTTTYCFERFRQAITTASEATGCQASFGPETLVLIREKLRSIWFFDRRSFLAVVEEVLRDNFNCPQTK